jgi:hypothetical protein
MKTRIAGLVAMTVMGSMVQMTQAAQKPTPTWIPCDDSAERGTVSAPRCAEYVCQSKTVDVTLTNVIWEDPQGDIVARIECRDRWSTVHIHDDAWIEATHYTRRGVLRCPDARVWPPARAIQRRAPGAA